MLSIAILSFIFALFRADVLFEPVHLLILLAVEIIVGEFLFRTISDSEDVNLELSRPEDEFKGYSLDEKSRKVMIYNIFYTVAIP